MEEKKISLHDFSIQLVLGVVLAGATAYFSIELYGKRLDENRTRLSFNERISIEQVDVTKKLVDQASIIFQYAPLYRNSELMELVYRGKIPDFMVDELKKRMNSSPKVSEKEIFDRYLEFQVSLIASKPYVNKEFFESLMAFSENINFFIHGQVEAKKLLEFYENSGKSLNEAFDKVREVYGFEKIPVSIMQSKA